MKRDQLEQELLALSAEELRMLLLDLYENQEMVRQDLALRFQSEGAKEDIISTYKSRISPCFRVDDYHLDKAVVETKKGLRFSDPEVKLEIGLFFVEEAVDFSNAFGYMGEDFYDEVLDIFAVVIDSLIAKPKLLPAVTNRLDKLLAVTVDLPYDIDLEFETIYNELGYLEEDFDY